jgi:hypothetical protein
VARTTAERARPDRGFTRKEGTMEFDKLAQVLRGMVLLTAVVAIGGCLAQQDRNNVSESATGSVTYYFDTDITPVLEAKCGGASCHDSPTPGYGGSVALNSPTYSDLVDQPAPQNTGYKLVDTTLGSASSYLYMKVIGDPGISGNRMTGMTFEEIQMLGDWIDQSPSAPETGP